MPFSLSKSASFLSAFLVLAVIVSTFANVFFLPPIPKAHAASVGIWLTQAEINALPMSGSAWNDVLNEANSSWGSACLDDNSCSHDVKTLAGALIAARTGDSSMRNKVVQGLQSAMQSSTSRTLELARGLQSYVIAADLINYRTSEFEAWLLAMLDDTSISGRIGGGLYNNALKDSTNWGGHERASSIAAVWYLGDDTRLNELARAHREFIGENVSPKTLTYQDTNWHAEPNNKAGMNRMGAIIQGINVSGVLPEDWRRDSEFTWPPVDIETYKWEGMQGFVVAAVILHRAGLVDIHEGNDAVVRAMNMLYGEGEAASNSPVYTHPAAGDDTWIPWLVNYYTGSSYPTDAAREGKGMGYTDWTHANPPSGDTTPPSVSLTAPSNGTIVSGTITVSANASDNIGVSSVQFFANGTSIGTDTSSPYSISWNTTAVSNGSYTITARATDTAGSQTTSSGVSVTVSNTTTPPPSSGEITSHPVVTGGSTNASTVTTASSVTAATGDLYLAAITTRSVTNVTTVSGLGLTWTEVRYQCAGRNATQISLWKAQGTPSGSGTVTATLGSTVSSAAIAVSRYSGVDATTPIGAIASANTNGINGVCSGGTDSANPAVSLTTTAADAFAYGAISLRNSTFTPGSGYAEKAEIASGSGGSVSGLAIEDRAVGVGTFPVNGTLSGAEDWAIVAIQIKPGAPSDTTPPTRSNGSPTGTLASGTTQTTLTLTTNENANCRYSTTAGTSHSSMPNTFGATGGTSHATPVSNLQSGQSYTYYVRCQDGAGNPNTSDYPISFSIASPSGNGTGLAPIADTYVQDDQPTSNFGTGSTLQIDGSPVKLSYLKFDLSSYAGQAITSGKLRLYVIDTSSGTQTVKTVADTTWSETAMTYNTRPAVGASVATISGSALNTWIEVDVTSALQGKEGSLVTMAIDSTATDGLDVHSRENTNKPELVLVTTITSSFAQTDRVQVNNAGGSVNIRSCASTSCAVVGTQPDRSLGTIISATPTTADGYTWHQIDFASGADGFVAENFLVFAGDLNRDKSVNSLDWSTMNSVWFTNSTTADVNKDGLVNSIDFGILNKNWGRSS